MSDKKVTYTPEQQRVADYIVEISDNAIGGGDDPIGFLIASHRALGQRSHVATTGPLDDPHAPCAVLAVSIASKAGQRELGEEIGAQILNREAPRSSTVTPDALYDYIVREMQELPDRSDTERLDYLERMLKRSPMWTLVCIETIPDEMHVAPCNKHHGDAAGRVTGKTLREAVDKVMAGDFAEALTS